MNEQAPDLRRSVQVMRRHKFLIGVVTVLGLLAGAAYSVRNPPALTSTALVLLPQAAQNAQQTGAGNPEPTSAATSGPDSYMATQIVVATSDPVLSAALATVSRAPSLQVVRGEVEASSPTPNILSISAKGTSAAQAEAITNAIASSYVAYIASSHNAFGSVPAQVLNKATSASGSPVVHWVIYGLLGLALGALLGVIAAFAISRHDRRLFRRDDIANSIGVPVLASVPVRHPADAAGWVRLMEDYQPGDVYGWRLRHALQQLGMASANVGNRADGSGSSLAVVSLSSDPKAVALGPQLAVYAASLGIPTTLLIGSHEEMAAVATLRTACAAPSPESSARPSQLRVAVSSRGDADGRPRTALTVVVVVVDSQTPEMAGTMSTHATVLGVSAGAATTEQLARVATSVAADGREVGGILVADPEPTDRTTGRIPQPPRPQQAQQQPQQPQQRVPTRLKETATEIRR
jgi:capsular polysaccharide biosynthesis protein